MTTTTVHNPIAADLCCIERFTPASITTKTGKFRTYLVTRVCSEFVHVKFGYSGSGATRIRIADIATIEYAA